MNNCKNCNTELTGNFCSGCGLPSTLKRIDKIYISKEISSVLNLDRGLFYTIKEMLIRPGSTARAFILDNRKRLVKPILFLIICSIIYNILQHFLSFEAGFINFDIEKSGDVVIGKMYTWLSNNFGYANILMAIPIALWTRIFFKNYGYNHYEIYVLLCFIMGNSILFYSFLGIIEYMINFPLLQLGQLFGVIYSTWAIGQFFDHTRKMSYLKGFLSYILGTVTSFLIFMLFAVTIQAILQ